MNFISYLHNIKKTSNNTELSYKRDLGKMRQYLEENGISGLNDITEEVLDSYIVYLEENQFAAATISRNIASNFSSLYPAISFSPFSKVCTLHRIFRSSNSLSILIAVLSLKTWSSSHIAIFTNLSSILCNNKKLRIIHDTKNCRQ